MFILLCNFYIIIRTKELYSLVSNFKYHIAGNLCRCTGYRPILQGLITLTTSNKVSNGCPMGEKCCMKFRLIENNVESPSSTPNKVVNGYSTENKCCMNTKSIENNVEDSLYSSEFLPYDPSQEPIFPPELKVKIN